MLSKSLIKVGFVGFGNIINAALGFAFLAAVAKTLSLDTFGKYALLTTLLISISKLIDFGTNSVFVAKSISKENPNLLNLFLSTKMLLTVITFPLYLIALALLREIDLNILLILFVGSVAYGINYTLFGLLQKEEKYVPLVILNLLPAIIKGVFALLIFFSIYKPGLTQAISIFSFSMLASSTLIILSAKDLQKFKFSLFGLREFLKNCYPAGVSQIVTETWPTISNTIAKVTGGFSNVGIFSLASKISHIFALISLSIFTVLLPKNANRKKQSLSYDFKETIVISAIIILIAVASIPFATTAIVKMFGAKFQDSLLILNILIFSAALTSIHSFIENYFFVEQKTNFIMYINLSKLGIFLTLCTLMVPAMHLKGLAISDLLSSISAVFFTIILVRKSRSV